LFPSIPKPDTTGCVDCAFLEMAIPDVDLLHALGTDAVSRKILKGGVLYPCQAIFLGRLCLYSHRGCRFEITKRLNGKDGTPSFVAVERSGVMLNEKMTRAEHATLIGLRK